ncbi:MAG TPA: hypothetical protein DEB06_02895 [Phycisphaerales bacterium]|nr:hypothetical protein [Phycisphaerales bacterium]
MPSITINGRPLEFKPGQTILQVANSAPGGGIAIPQYCYHDGLSIVASCRICLAEVWAPNPRNNNKLESMGKLLPTCQTACTDGMVVYTDSPKSIANQKAVMEYLLINHPLDCPVCDQAGECFLQDYSYEYGRGVSRFEETKVKQPKKDLGPHVYLYSDRCIMCSRCVRFTREVTGTAELMIQGRGNTEQIDVFPGVALDNELSANVTDLCPVGALLDKDFLFAQRVWFLKSAPSIDGITASGDNILVEHNNGQVYRLKPRTNMEVNKWWISDEIRYGWKFVHDEQRLRSPVVARFGKRVECDFARAYDEFVENASAAVGAGKRLALMVSPMLACEEAYLLAQAALAIDPRAVFAVGPVPSSGADKSFPGGYTIYAEKAPNARGVRRVLEALARHFGASDGRVRSFAELLGWLKSPTRTEIGALLLTGNYPSEWATEEFADAVVESGASAALIDTLPNRLSERVAVLLPGATWVEKSGSFENAKGLLQAFEQAIPVIELAKTEGQIALDLLARVRGEETSAVGGGAHAEARSFAVDAAPGQVPGGTTVLLPRGRTAYNPAEVRRQMAREVPELSQFVTAVRLPSVEAKQSGDMEVVEL